MKKFILGFSTALLLMASPAVNAGEIVKDSLRASCSNCGKKSVELGTWDVCALSSVRIGSPSSGCGMNWTPEGWQLVLYDALSTNYPHPTECRAICFSVDKPPGNMTGRETVEGGPSSAPVSIPPSSGHSDVLRSVYSTTYGDWTPEYRGSGEYWGRYPEDSGRIFGTLSGYTFDGYWAEGSSSQRCSTQKDGSYYWGRMVMSFNADYSSFEGKYGYCDATPSRGWDGKAK